MSAKIDEFARKISNLLADAAMRNWDETGNSWRWKNLEDLKLEASEILSSCSHEEMEKILETAKVIEGCVYEAGSSDESQYSCASMDIDQTAFKKGVIDLRDNYLELIENDEPGEYANDDEIMGMSLENDSIIFPFGQSYSVTSRSAWDFLDKIGVDPDEFLEEMMAERNQAAPK